MIGLSGPRTPTPGPDQGLDPWSLPLVPLDMDSDEFGRDPAVCRMRRVFAQMEKLQRKLIEAASLPPLDRRLRVWREQALQLFEQAWARAGRRSLAKTEEEAALLYTLCLAHILERGRITLPATVLPRHEALEQVIREILK
jgi:hypothetical protein